MTGIKRFGRIESLLVPMVMLMAIGCSEVKFERAQEASQGLGGDPSSGDPPLPAGEVKSSYFFVKRAADILFVVDTSGSMGEEQALLRSGFPSFTSTLNEVSGGTLDWRLAITSTDVASSGVGNQGALVEFSKMPSGTFFLDSDMDVAQANVSFQATVMLGLDGSGDERGIAAARQAVQREFNSATTHGFIRVDTPLSVIVLSDEDERSVQDPANSEYKPFEPIDEPANFIPGIRALDTQSSIPKTITFHSIVTSTKVCLDGAGSYMGETYMSLSALTNGIIGDICALKQGYQDQLQALAVNIINEAKTYSLPCNEIASGTAKAYEQTLTGALVLVQSTFVAPNKIVLENAPPVGSLIKAKFTCLD